MTYTFTMRGCQRIGDLDRIAQCLVQGQWASSEASRQGLSLEVLHYEESTPSWRPTSKMGQMCGLLSVARIRASRPNRCRHVGFGRQRPGYDLDSNGPFQASVVALVDLPHAASTERLKNFHRVPVVSRGKGS
jgi:hypothetical protein